MRAISENIHAGLQQLYLSYSNIGDIGAVSIGEGLSKSRYLKVLILNNNEISDEGTKCISEALARPTVNL